MGNWWADKLGTQQRQPAVAVPQPQPVPQGYQAPPGYVLVPQGQPAAAPVPYVIQPPPGFKEPPRPVYNPNDPNRPVTHEELAMLNLPPGASQEMTVFAVAAARTSGSRNVKRYEQTPCPECGSHLFFTRSHPALRKMNTESGQMVSPSPRCEACGYNGLFEQHGTHGGAGESVVGGADPGDAY